MIDTESVTEAIRQQFPDVNVTNVRHLGEGCDIVTVLEKTRPTPSPSFHDSGRSHRPRRQAHGDPASSAPLDARSEEPVPLHARVDDGVLQRARYVAACLGVSDVALGLERARPRCVTAGLRALALTTTTPR